MTERPPELLTVAEVAGVLKLNQQTVRNWIDEGRLPAIRVGRRVRVRRSDFETLIEAGYSGRDVQRRSTDAFTAPDFWDGSKSHPPPRLPSIEFSAHESEGAAFSPPDS